MNNLFIFTKYSLKWQFKWFILANLMCIFSLLMMEVSPDLIPVVGLLHFYILLLYSIFSAFSISGYNNNANPFGNSFSGKYLQSLPISKIRLVLILAFSNLYTLTPTLISLFWVGIRWSGNPALDLGKYQAVIDFIAGHWASVTGVMILLYFILLFYQIGVIIELPRRMYNRGSLSNTLMYIKGFFRFIGLGSLLMIAMNYSIFERVSWPLLTAMFGFSLFLFWRAYQLQVKEELSYWSTKRDLSHILFYLILALVDSSYYYSFLKHTSHTYGWKAHFSKGPQIFIDIANEDWTKVDEYPSNGEKLSIRNPDGVAVIHYLSLIDFTKVKGLEGQIIGDKELMSLPIKADEGSCIGAYYCEGVTPAHLLAAKGHHKIISLMTKNNPKLSSLRTNLGETPLHYASKFCAYTSTKSLLDNGADIDAANILGDTPLMIAAEKGCDIVASLLLRKGANPRIKNSSGETAYEIAVKKNHTGIAFLIDTEIDDKK